MRTLIILALLGISTTLIVGCEQKAANPTGPSNLVLGSIAAEPTVVPPGASSVITCRVVGAEGKALTYQWTASGAYGSLVPMDSICLFSSPSCHMGRAEVTCSVSDGSGAPLSATVVVNE